MMSASVSVQTCGFYWDERTGPSSPANTCALVTLLTPKGISGDRVFRDHQQKYPVTGTTRNTWGTQLG